MNKEIVRVLASSRWAPGDLRIKFPEGRAAVLSAFAIQWERGNPVGVERLCALTTLSRSTVMAALREARACQLIVMAENGTVRLTSFKWRRWLSQTRVRRDLLDTAEYLQSVEAQGHA